MTCFKKLVAWYIEKEAFLDLQLGIIIVVLKSLKKSLKVWLRI